MHISRISNSESSGSDPTSSPSECYLIRVASNVLTLRHLHDTPINKLLPQSDRSWTTEVCVIALVLSVSD